MKRNKAIKIIRSHRKQLEAAGVAHAYLFGSVARDEANSKSDIDVMIDVAYEPFTLFKIAHVMGILEDLFHRRVDVVVRADALDKSRRLYQAAKEALSVF